MGIIMLNDTNYADNGIIMKNSTSYSFYSPNPDTGDVTWERELIDEWDFTQSLTSKIKSIPFTITSGATYISNTGIKIDSTNSSVSMDLILLDFTNWNECDIELIMDFTDIPNVQETQQFFTIYNSDWSNYSCGPLRQNKNLYCFLDNRKSMSPEYTGTHLFDKNFMVKMETGTTSIYGSNYLIAKTTSVDLSAKFAERTTAGTNTLFYLGSGYNGYSFYGAIYKGLKFYHRIENS